MRHRRLGVLFAVGLLLGLSLVVGLTRPDSARALESDEQQLLELINAYRAENGLGALTPSPNLQTAAERHSEDMSTYGFFSHTTQASSYYAAGSGHADRVQAEGYPSDSYTAENLAMDYATPEEVLAAWQNSPGHNAALLDGSYTAAGIGHVGAYWTLNMGSVAGASEAAPATEEQYEEQQYEGDQSEEEQYEEPDAPEEAQAEAQTQAQGATRPTEAEADQSEENKSEDQYTSRARYTDDQYDESGTDDSEPAWDRTATQYEEPTTEETGVAGRAAVREPATPEDGDMDEKPSDEAIESFLTEARATEEQYDARDISGSGDEPAGPAEETAAPDLTPPAAPETEKTIENAAAERGAGTSETVEETETTPSAAPPEATTVPVVLPAQEEVPAEEASIEEGAPVEKEAHVVVEKPAAEESVAVETGTLPGDDEREASARSGEGSVYGIAMLPNTGGPSLSLLAVGLLLVGGGLISRRALR